MYEQGYRDLATKMIDAAERKSKPGPAPKLNAAEAEEFSFLENSSGALMTSRMVEFRGRIQTALNAPLHGAILKKPEAVEKLFKALAKELGEHPADGKYKLNWQETVEFFSETQSPAIRYVNIEGILTVSTAE